MDRALMTFGGGASYYLRLKIQFLLERARCHFNDLSRLNILDLGCGIGASSMMMRGQFAAVHGVDSSADMIHVASSHLSNERMAGPSPIFSVGDSSRLPYRSASFDILCCINVLHHVPPDRVPNSIREAARVIRRGGLAIFCEHNPYNPLTRYIVGRCEFDRDATLIPAGLLQRETESAFESKADRDYLAFFPHFLRLFSPLEKWLKRVPLGAQYAITATRL